MPVKGVIVFSSTKSRVVKSPDHTDVIYATSIPVYLRTLEREKECLSASQMEELAQIIVEEHKPYFPYPMCKRWGINPSDLMTGVQCGKCEQFGMVKRNNGWICTSCGNIDKVAHVQALYEWFALVENRISNKECRKFLRIDSSQLASRLLNSMSLSRVNKSKNTIYRWRW